MKLKDDVDLKLNGRVYYNVTNIETGETLKTDISQNLVVTTSRTIMRDLVYGLDKMITKVKFGDMNLTPGDDLINVPAPQLNDTGLVNQIYEKNISTKEIKTIDGRPAIEYTIELAEVEANNSDGGQTLITEIALSNAENVIFARKTHPVVTKNSNTKLILVWQLLF